jgi:hypothetical protein
MTVPVGSPSSGAIVMAVDPEPVHWPPSIVVYGPVKMVLVVLGSSSITVPVLSPDDGGTVMKVASEPVQDPPVKVV